MATYTSNYGLHQWEPEDNFLRTDFNEDLKKIDTAIRAAKDQAEGLETSKAMVSAGGYTGDGATTRVINLGFRPKAVLVENQIGSRYGSNGSSGISGGLATDGFPVYYQDSNGRLPSTLEIVANGFQVRYGDGRSSLNGLNDEYRYLAIK